ncbi:SGNH/GDSL hydrolase family protein [Halocola ammonii]
MKPVHTLLFLLAVAALSAITMHFFPKDGIQVTENFTLVFPKFEDFKPDTTEEHRIEDIEAYLEAYDDVFEETEVDSTAIKDSLARIQAERRKKLLRIQWKGGDRSSLEPFFSSLTGKAPDTSSIRVMHYGDSQIEADRITSYLRNEFQKEFGGEGPGLLPVVQTIETSAIVQRNSENWHIYSLIGKRDTMVTHDRYGLRGTFAQFTPIAPDSLLKDSATTAWVEFEPSPYTYNRAKRYGQVKLFYGNVVDTTTVSVFLNDSLIQTDTLQLTIGNALKVWNFESTPEKLRFVFKGKRSPEFYGFSLQSKTGVHMDNIAMRGSSGTIFRRISSGQLDSQYEELNVKMILLQYGGNTVPYIEDSTKAANYGRWFASQIRFLQRLNPDVAMILIGPSDMATKVGTEFKTYPFLELVRDELKEAAFETGIGFWDLYEVMGGKNSMQSWVEAEPPLAGSDYVHFTGKGARRVAELFRKALWKDFEEWKTSEKTTAKDTTKKSKPNVPVDSTKTEKPNIIQ